MSDADPKPEATPEEKPRRRYSFRMILLLLLALPFVLGAAWIGITLSYSYSSGERAGYLQKISKRGWLCKTWEGEMQLSAIPGSAPEKFLFTTRSDSLARELNRLNGRRVVVDYEQHKGVPSCFGDTEYFVDGVRLVEGDPAP